MPRPLNSIRRTGVAFASPVQGEVAARKGSRRGCTVGFRRGVSFDSLLHVDSLHPLSHGQWPVTAPPTQGAIDSEIVGPYFLGKHTPPVVALPLVSTSPTGRLRPPPILKFPSKKLKGN